MNKSKIYGLSLVILLTALSSCLDEFQADETIISSEELIFVSAERVALLGRLHATPSQPDAVGFQISETADFGSPIIVESDSEPEVGAFVARYDNLTAGTTYFARAFADEGGSLTFGEVIEFESLVTNILSFAPTNAKVGSTIVILGSNFASSTQVFFGDQVANVVTINLESRIEVTVPDIDDSALVNIRVVSGEDELTFTDPFEYHIGNWSKVTDFPSDVQLAAPVIMDLGDQVVVGYGKSIEENVLSTGFWSFNKDAETWTEIAAPAFSTPVEDAISFSSGYASGTAALGFGALLQTVESWNYDAASSLWAFGGVVPWALSAGIGVELNGTKYVFGGVDDAILANRTIWALEEGGAWEEIGRAPLDITTDFPHFVYNNEFYYQADNFNIVKYNPITQEWSLFFQASIDLGSRGIAEVIGDKVYIGMGLPRRDFLEINLLTGESIEKNLYPGIVAENNVASWAHNGRVFVLRTAVTNQATTAGIERMEVWSLNPNALKVIFYEVSIYRIAVVLCLLGGSTKHNNSRPGE